MTADSIERLPGSADKTVRVIRIGARRQFLAEEALIRLQELHPRDPRIEALGELIRCPTLRHQPRIEKH